MSAVISLLSEKTVALHDEMLQILADVASLALVRPQSER